MNIIVLGLTNPCVNLKRMHQLYNGILISLVITCKIRNNFLSKDKLNDCTTDSKNQESIQLSITSDKGHRMGK